MLKERLKLLRKEAGLTQKEMAAHFNTSQPSYQQWESGKRVPNSDNLEKLANFFNVSTDYLLGNSDYKSPASLDNLIELVLNSETLTYKDETLSDSQVAELKDKIRQVIGNC